MRLFEFKEIINHIEALSEAAEVDSLHNRFDCTTKAYYAGRKDAYNHVTAILRAHVPE